MNLSNNQIRDISDIIDWKYSNLQILHLNACGIEKIGGLDLPKLEEIQLSDNRIKDITPMVQWKCPQLKNISITDSGIENMGSLDMPSL